MKIIKYVNTLCPICLNQLQGELIKKNNKILLYRNCPKDGPIEAILSSNVKDYIDWDNFQTAILNQIKPSTLKITNYTLMCTPFCQMDCDYCHVKVPSMNFEHINKTEFDAIIKILAKNKETVTLVLSGGEPTIHPDFFYFIEKANKSKIPITVMTNGLEIAKESFCKKIVSSGIKEIRICFESLSTSNSYEIVPKESLEAKMQALANMTKENFQNIILSPMIFKGINEELLVQTLNYAKDKYYIKRIEGNGFSWVGPGITRDQKQMIMPDEMMDIIHKNFNTNTRKELFTFQKALFAFSRLVNGPTCKYHQIMIFIRNKNNLIPISQYFNLKKMNKLLIYWQKLNNKKQLIQLISFCLLISLSIKLKILLLSKDILYIILTNIFPTIFNKFPSKLLPLVLVTNCSPLTADSAVCNKECTNRLILKRNGKITKTLSANLALLNSHKKNLNL